MNFLFIPAHNSIYDILWALQSMNYPVDILETTPFDPNQSVEEQNEQLRKQLSSHSYDCVISYLTSAVFACPARALWESALERRSRLAKNRLPLNR